MSWTTMYLVLSVLCLSGPGSVIIASSQGQMTEVKELERGDDWQCPSMEERERARNEIHQIAYSVMSSVCRGPGWRRVAFINMTDTSYTCPTGLNLTSYSKRTCGRSHTNRYGCSSTTFSVRGLPYNHVCGRIRAYQWGVTSAFWQYDRGIFGQYVDGVSLTHGGAGRRRHIWTFVAGVTEVTNTDLPIQQCPCDTSSYDRVPTFVGNDYFCESGFHSPLIRQHVLFPNDVLWDGQNCTSTSTCCQLNNPPWFTKTLPTATTDDIELRLCTSHIPDFEDVPIELIELYVK